MKKSLIVACILLLALNAFAVFAAGTSPYRQAGGLVTAGGVAPAPRMTAHLRAHGCNLDITSVPDTMRFVGLARQECLDKNKHNLMCQRRCFEQVRLMTYSDPRNQMGVYSRQTCTDVDAVLLASATASQCYFDAGNECTKANVGNDYCRKKCTQKTYAMCRQNIMSNRRIV